MQIHKSKTLPPQKIRASGFTLLELLMVISIIGMLALIIFSSLSRAYNKSYYSRSLEEFHSIDTALELYLNDHNDVYPADVSRNLPPGLQTYLGTGNWPNAPYPNSVYDWDNWAPGDLSYPPYSQVYQISIRFCSGSSAPGVCTIPNETWAAGFDYYSALYYCISGPCRSHSSQPTNYPGKCVGNCPVY